MAQSIYGCFAIQYPKSGQFFGNSFKIKICELCAKWTMGCIPSTVAIEHWQLMVINNNNNNNNGTGHEKSEEIDESTQYMNEQKFEEDIIPTNVIKKKISLMNSEFVKSFKKMFYFLFFYFGVHKHRNINLIELLFQFF